MKNPAFFCCLLLMFCCKTKEREPDATTISEDIQMPSEIFTLAFGSCNDQNRPQPLWKSIVENEPKTFIWVGDNVYADTADMTKMKSDYEKVKANPDYKILQNKMPVLGTWDDHDYGKNDAGIEWEHKEGAKDLFLHFFDAPSDDIRRNREGVYMSTMLSSEKHKIKVILLDTRYFRTGLNKSLIEGRRYDSWTVEDGGSILGEKQWEWFEKELEDDTAQFTIIVSSIQFLSDLHGWEKWGNHPSEVLKMNEMLKNAKANNILFLTGDRHQAEFSSKRIEGMPYDIIDFTSSGLTHTYPGSPIDTNPYRVGNGSQEINFGLLHFNFDTNEIRMEIRGKDNVLIEDFVQQY